MVDHPLLDLSPIKKTLKLLGYAPQLLVRCEVASGGISGSAVFRLNWADETLILKVTEATAARHVKERAYREIHFYRSLAHQIPLTTPRVLASFTGEAGSALLLAAYRAAAPPALWHPHQFVEVARQLACLHAIYWDAVDRLSSLDWLPQRHAG